MGCVLKLVIISCVILINYCIFLCFCSFVYKMGKFIINRLNKVIRCKMFSIVFGFIIVCNCGFVIVKYCVKFWVVKMRKIWLFVKFSLVGWKEF